MKQILSIYFILTLFVSATTSSLTGGKIKISAKPTQKDDICHKINIRYRRAYIAPTYYLSVYWEIMKKLNCPQFRDECNKKTFRFSPFTSLLSEEMCNRTSFIKTCTPKLQQVLASSESNWTVLSSYAANVTAWNAVGEPCVQVAIHDQLMQTYGYSFGRFEESKLLMNPYSGYTWCGVNTKNLHFLSVYLCSPTRWRANAWILLIFFGILGFIVTVVNFLAFAVIVSNHDLRNGQGIFRLNLAFIDFVTGAVVIPASMYTYYHYTIRPIDFTPVPVGMKQIAHQFFTQPVVDYSTAGQVNMLFSRGSHYQFPPIVVNSIGFIMQLVLTENIFSLAVAGVDRLIAISIPFSYDAQKSKKVSAFLCLGTWAVAITIAAMPIFKYKGMMYMITDNMFFFINGPAHITQLTLAVPLIVMWTLAIAIFVKMRVHNRRLSTKTKSVKNNLARNEARLANTLTIMVAFFTLAVLPMCIISIYLSKTPKMNFFQVETAPLDALYLVINLHTTGQIISLCNSVVNFFIYQKRDQTFKTQLKKMFGMKTEGYQSSQSAVTSTTNVK